MQDIKVTIRFENSQQLQFVIQDTTVGSEAKKIIAAFEGERTHITIISETFAKIIPLDRFLNAIIEIEPI